MWKKHVEEDERKVFSLKNAHEDKGPEITKEEII